MKLSHVLYLQKGDSQTYRTADKNSWMVLHEVWEGSKLLRVTSEGSFNTREEADAAAKKLAAKNGWIY